MVATTERENSFNARNGGPTWPEICFLSPVLTKGFLLLSPEAAMLPGSRVETHPLHPVPPFLLMQNLSPRDIAGSDITR